jgi:hypothetical protein
LRALLYDVQDLAGACCVLVLLLLAIAFLASLSAIGLLGRREG